MHLTTARSIRLVARGGSGLACDNDGVALGAVSLVEVSPVVAQTGRWRVRPIEELGEILLQAYGVESGELVQRCHRALTRVAAQFEAGDLALAALEAVLIGLPDLTSQALAKLAGIADAEKAGTAWQDQPRVPAGQTGGGQWTSDGGAAAPAQLDDRAAQSGEQGPATASTGGAKPQLDDGVYRPGENSPVLMHTGGGADEEPREGVGGNRPPGDPMTLEDIFPALKDNPVVAVPLAPIVGLLGISASADAANLAATMLEYNRLVAQIRSVDPKWVDSSNRSGSQSLDVTTAALDLGS